jgi:hypothetical protein
MIVFILAVKSLLSELILHFSFVLNVNFFSSYKTQTAELIRKRRTKHASRPSAFLIAPEVSKVKKKGTSVFEDVRGRGDGSLLRKVYIVYNGACIYVYMCWFARIEL